MSTYPSYTISQYGHLQITWTEYRDSFNRHYHSSTQCPSVIQIAHCIEWIRKQIIVIRVTTLARNPTQHNFVDPVQQKEEGAHMCNYNISTSP